ncbi:hypothetical protein DPMN_109774 [Dreissena polymorpha]|uniref:Uncharacterized protein n=1 Tax=Dreissena polymorpha TaxID=45954 RepID=A0A9D4KBL0_DREPO|nr:hypothetical protein DPMN_109774 [Dreissena polymorpha]
MSSAKTSEISRVSSAETRFRLLVLVRNKVVGVMASWSDSNFIHRAFFLKTKLTDCSESEASCA